MVTYQTRPNYDVGAAIGRPVGSGCEFAKA